MHNIETMDAVINSIMYVFSFACGYMLARYTKG
jgi:hypothetical protein